MSNNQLIVAAANTTEEQGFLDKCSTFIADAARHSYAASVHTIGGVTEAVVQAAQATPDIYRTGREDARASTKAIFAKYLRK